MPSLYRALVIYSPHAGRSQQLSEALAVLQQAGIEIAAIVPIGELSVLPSQNERWSKQNIDLVIAAGGDGLIGGVLPFVTEQHLPLGIVPLGTSNNTARALDIPQDLPGAADVLVKGHTQDIDLGIADSLRGDALERGTGQGELGESITACRKPFPFAHALTVGLHVQFARIATNVATRERYGPLTYAFATFEVLQHPSAFEVELHFEGLSTPYRPPCSHGNRQRRLVRTAQDVPLRSRAFEVAVVNAPLFGGGRQFTIPGASIGDGLLDIVIVEEGEFGPLKRGLAQFLRREEREFGLLGNRLTELFGGRGKLAQFSCGQPVTHPADLTDIPGIHHVQARGVTITTEAGPQQVALDGELHLETPLSVHVLPRQLRVLAPKASKCHRDGHGRSGTGTLGDAHQAAIIGAG